MSAKALSFGGSVLSGPAGFLASAAGVCAAAAGAVELAGCCGCCAKSMGVQRSSNEKRKPVRFFIWSTPLNRDGEKISHLRTRGVDPCDQQVRGVPRGVEAIRAAAVKFRFGTITFNSITV